MTEPLCDAYTHSPRMNDKLSLFSVRSLYQCNTNVNNCIEFESNEVEPFLRSVPFSIFSRLQSFSFSIFLFNCWICRRFFFSAFVYILFYWLRTLLFALPPLKFQCSVSFRLIPIWFGRRTHTHTISLFHWLRLRMAELSRNVSPNRFSFSNLLLPFSIFIFLQKPMKTMCSHMQCTLADCRHANIYVWNASRYLK